MSENANTMAAIVPPSRPLRSHPTKYCMIFWPEVNPALTVNPTNANVAVVAWRLLEFSVSMGSSGYTLPMRGAYIDVMWPASQGLVMSNGTRTT